jgi:DNA-binding PadR family transcriptional regulator
LSSLVKQGFLKENPADGATVFSVTQKGKEVLAYYRKIEEELYPRKRTSQPKLPTHEVHRLKNEYEHLLS